jgi:hypothetical protein
MLAHHGQALAEAAEAAGVNLRFEAAVAGGIPVVKALTEGLAGNAITRVMGVMNGTCNYILTRMDDAGLTYEEAFAEADGLGYVEADPELDVGGIDAGHKLSLLASIAFGTRVAFDDMRLEGIGRISIDDIRRAGDLGYKIKLLGVAQMTGRGLEQRMTPCLVPSASPLGQLVGGTNMVVIEGDAVEQIVLRGPGAGEGPHGERGDGRRLRHRAGDHHPGLRPARGLARPRPARQCRKPRLFLPAPVARRQTRRAGEGRDGPGRERHLDRPDAAIRSPRGRRAGADRDPQDGAAQPRHRACRPARGPASSRARRWRSGSRTSRRPINGFSAEKPAGKLQFSRTQNARFAAPRAARALRVPDVSAASPTPCLARRACHGYRWRNV